MGTKSKESSKRHPGTGYDRANTVFDLVISDWPGSLPPSLPPSSTEKVVTIHHWNAVLVFYNTDLALPTVLPWGVVPRVEYSHFSQTQISFGVEAQ